jgi:hypothetical protein
MDWQTEGVNADAVFEALCNEGGLEPDGRGGVVLKRFRPAKGKESEPMSRSRDNDEVATALAEVIEKMSASDQRTLRKFLEAVTEEVDAVKKDASSDFLDQLRAYFESYIRQLGEIPSGEGNPTDPKQPTRFVPGPKPTAPQAGSLSPAMKALVRKAAEAVVAGNIPQDHRGLIHNPLADAVASARKLDEAGTPMRKSEGAKTGGGDVEQVDLTTDVVASAQAERDRVAAQRRG